MYFTESHEWISLDDQHGKVGITNYAQQELGEIVFVSLPKVGQKIKAGEEICVLESTKAAADVYSPVSGTIVEVNETLRNNPSLLNTHPESDGWLFKIELSNPKELKALMSQPDYIALLI